ncbi:MAG TPA: hypothetical protein VGG29_03925 [Caulobacteraceae bacterium]|jgi:hypothetical protein
MASRDLFNNINPKLAIAPAAAATDNTPWVSAILDTEGYESATLVIVTGSLADADATFTVLFEDGAQANLSDHAEVATSLQLGSEAAASFNFGNDSQCFKIGYHGGKRYLRATITPANNAGNAFVAAIWVLGHPHHAPTANPPN